MEYKVHYTDAKHDCNIIIQNHIREKASFDLSFELDGITFVGDNLNDFQLADKADYEEAKEKVYLLKHGGNNEYNDKKKSYTYSLMRYRMQIEIRVLAVERRSGNLHTGIITMDYIYREHDMAKIQVKCLCDRKQVFWDDAECLKFCLSINERNYFADRPDTDFEMSLLQINEKCRNEYLLRCCFTCQYSDYSPYGSDDFGSMLCYKGSKEIYLMVNDKMDYFEKLEGVDSDRRQETDCCDSFEERIQCEGYRGKV